MRQMTLEDYFLLEGDSFVHSVTSEMIRKAIPPLARGQAVISRGAVFFRFGGMDAEAIMSEIKRLKEEALKSPSGGATA